MRIWHILLSLLMLIMLNRSSSFVLGGSRIIRNGRGYRSGAVMSTVDGKEGAVQHKKLSKGPVPITVLSGFLGAGKTSFLSNTLATRGDTRFGLVVNDMATVNVDAKQIRQQTMDPFGGIDTMELQDGCVCCTLAEDLIASVSKLVSLSDLKQERYDHIVVECSGIAEPRKVRDLFQQAEDYKLELLKKVRLDTLVTLVDATVFLNLFGTEDAIATHRQLAYRENSSKALQERQQDPNDLNTYIELDGSEQRKITDLLLEQVECADIVLINKCDLLKSPAEVELVKKVVASINPMAKVLTCVNGVVPEPLSIVGSAAGKGAVDWGVLDEHRKLILAVETAQAAVEQARIKQKAEEAAAAKTCVVKDCHDPSHHHDHSHGHSHGHSHEHGHIHATVATSAVAAGDDVSRGDHYGHTHDASCHDSTCTDPSHAHNHGHSHSHAVVQTAAHKEEEKEHCHDHTCTDPTHDHDHSHGHSHGHNHDHVHGNADMTTAEKDFGITSFVYRRRRPFHPIRFSMFLQSLGQLSVKGVSEMSGITTSSSSSSSGRVVGGGTATVTATAEEALVTRAKRALLRSKGFVWMGTSAQAAYFMSHAGQYLELLVLGRWWAAIDRAQWPQQPAVLQDITVDFDGDSAHGDRRQEVVFIGQFARDGGTSQRALEGVLDECLLTDAEMKEYEAVAKQGDDALRSHFAPGH